MAMNPIIKFTTLFELLAVELAVEMDASLSSILAGGFFAAACFFVWRSFYRMRIGADVDATAPVAAAPPGVAALD